MVAPAKLATPHLGVAPAARRRDDLLELPLAVLTGARQDDDVVLDLLVGLEAVAILDEGAAILGADRDDAVRSTELRAQRILAVHSFDAHDGLLRRPCAVALWIALALAVLLHTAAPLELLHEGVELIAGVLVDRLGELPWHRRRCPRLASNERGGGVRCGCGGSRLACHSRAVRRAFLGRAGDEDDRCECE